MIGFVFKGNHFSYSMASGLEGVSVKIQSAGRWVGDGVAG